MNVNIDFFYFHLFSDCVIRFAHCGERIHSLCCWRPLRCCVSLNESYTHHPLLLLLLLWKQFQTSKLNVLLPSLQVSLLPVWHSNRNAVSGQCCVRSTAATSVSGYDGTPRGRPTLGMNSHTHI